MYVGLCWVTGGLCEARGSLGSELCEYLMIYEVSTSQNSIFRCEGVTVTLQLLRKYTKKVPQHLRKRVCGGYVRLLEDCVRSGGHRRVNYESIS